MILSREQKKSVVLSYNSSCFQVKVSQMMNCSNHALSVNVSQFIFDAKQLKVNNTVKRKKTLIWPLVTTVESSMQESSALLLREDIVNEDFRQTTVTMVM